MSKLWVFGLIGTACVLVVYAVGASGGISGLPLKIRSGGNVRDAIVWISTSGDKSVTVRHVLINNKHGLNDCDIDLYGEYVNASTSGGNTWVRGPRKLSLGDELSIDLNRAGPCGEAVARVHVDTDQGSVDLDVN